MSDFNWCHGPECHTRHTVDRVRGVKGTSKNGVPYYVYYDLDSHGYRTATTSWKVRH